MSCGRECYTKTKNSLIYFTIVIFSLVVSSMAFAKVPTVPLIGIIVPMEVESHHLVDAITDKKEVTVQGIHYTLGKIAHKNVVFALSGLGKINAAIIATQLLNQFHPDLMILSGSSGIINPQLKKGDVIVGRTVDDIDLGILNGKGHEFSYPEDIYQPQIKKYLPLAFTLNPHLADFLLKLNKTTQQKFSLGKIATTDVLPNPPQQVKWMKDINVDVVEMEGASLMQVCWLFEKPCVVVRGASNFTTEKITHADIEMAADHAANVAIEIIKNY